MGKTFNLLGFFNQKGVISDNFHVEDRIEHTAQLFASYTSFKIATYTETWIDMNELVTETDVLQIGQQSAVNFTSIAWGEKLGTLLNQYPTKAKPE